MVKLLFGSVWEVSLWGIPEIIVKAWDSVIACNVFSWGVMRGSLRSSQPSSSPSCPLPLPLLAPITQSRFVISNHWNSSAYHFLSMIRPHSYWTWEFVCHLRYFDFAFAVHNYALILIVTILGAASSETLQQHLSRGRYVLVDHTHADLMLTCVR